MTEADSASAGMRLPDVWRSHLADGVGVALCDHKAGEWIELDGIVLRLPEAIPKGHKFALRPHGQGEPVLRYGAPIGLASQPIAAGEHVHSHNLATALDGEMEYGTFAPPAPSPEALSLIHI